MSGFFANFSLAWELISFGVSILNERYFSTSCEPNSAELISPTDTTNSLITFPFHLGTGKVITIT